MQHKLFFFALLSAVVGCTTGGSQLTTCQAEKEQLLTSIRTQRETARSLTDKLASVESRLDQAEKELARSGGSGTRFSSLPVRTNPQSTPSSPPAKNDSLPWRSPGGKPDLTPPTSGSPSSSNSSVTKQPRGSLAALAKRDNRVRYDATTHAAEVTSQVQFDDKSATISAAGKRQLDEVARLLRSDEARDLPIVVTAPDAARAKAVADYLDRHGIPEERLAVSTSARQSSASAKATGSDGVQVFVLDSDASVAEWGTKTGLRR